MRCLLEKTVMKVVIGSFLCPRLHTLYQNASSKLSIQAFLFCFDKSVAAPVRSVRFDAMQRIGYSYILRRFDNQLAGA
jgi:hypothetical protein